MPPIGFAWGGHTWRLCKLRTQCFGVRLQLTLCERSRPDPETNSRSSMNNFYREMSGVGRAHVELILTVLRLVFFNRRDSIFYAAWT